MKNDKNIDAFEKYLRQSVKEHKKTNLSTEEVLNILKSYSPPDDLEILKDEKINQIMKDEYEKRTQLENKFNNFSLIHSLGELIQSYCDFKRISSNKLAKVLGLSDEEIDNYLKDRISPDNLKKDLLLNLMLVIGIPINDMVQIIDKTLKLFQIKRKTNLAANYVRMEKGIEESKKMRVKDSAMKELLLSLKDEEGTITDEFEELKNGLRKDFERIQEYKNIQQCYTIKTPTRKGKINQVLQLI